MEENHKINPHAQIHKDWADKQPKCKSCEHLLSFHGENGCRCWQLGVSAVPVYSCACQYNSFNQPGKNVQNNILKPIGKPTAKIHIKPYQSGGTNTIPPPISFTPSLNVNPFVSASNFIVKPKNIPQDFQSTYQIYDWRQASSMLFGRIQNNMAFSLKKITPEQEKELIDLAIQLRNKMNQIFTDEGIV